MIDYKLNYKVSPKVMETFFSRLAEINGLEAHEIFYGGSYFADNMTKYPFILKVADDCFLAFIFHGNDSKIFFNRIYSSHQGWNPMGSFRLKLEKNQSGETKESTESFYQTLLMTVKKDEGSDFELCEEELSSVWNEYLTLEGNILKRDQKQAQAITITKIVSNDRDNFLIEVSGSDAKRILEKQNSDYDVVLPSGTTLSVSFEPGPCRSQLQVFSGNPKRLHEVKRGCLLVENFGGKKAEHDRKRRALNAFLRDEAKNKDLKKLLFHPEGLQESNVVKTPKRWFNTELSEQARQLTSRVLGNDDIFLVQGPPGTGKTTVISEICSQLASDGKQVLVASQSNLAVDNVAEKILSFGDPSLKMLRFADPEKIKLDEVRKITPVGKASSIQNQTTTTVREQIGTLSELGKYPSKISLDLIEILENRFTLIERLMKSKEKLEVAKSEKRSATEDLQGQLRGFSLTEFFEKHESCDLGPSNIIRIYDYGIDELQKAMELEDQVKASKAKAKELKSKLEIVEDKIKRMSRNSVSLPAKERELEDMIFNLRLSIWARFKDWLFKDVDKLKHEVLAMKEGRERAMPLLEYRREELIEEVKGINAKLKETEIDRELIDFASNKKVWNAILFCKRLDIGKEKSDLAVRVAKALGRTTLERRVAGIAKARKIVSLKEDKLLQSEAEVKNAADVLSLCEGELNNIGHHDWESYSKDDLADMREHLNRFDELGDLLEIQEELIGFHATINKQGYSGELVEEYVIETNKIFLTTCSYSAKEQFKSGLCNFDYVIIDEASKSMPTEILIPLVLGKKIVLVGDHKQLPPFYSQELKEKLSKKENDLLETSLFENVFDRISESKKCLLDRQYRMPPQISRLVSKLFYGDVLQDSMAIKSKNYDMAQLGAHIKAIDVKGKFKTKSAESGSGCNLEEVAEIKRVLTLMKRDGLLENKEVGIITNYKYQVDKLENTLESLNKDIDLEIGTIDAFQGREKHVVILSTVVVGGSMSAWCQDPRRINVAISRTREQLIIVGDLDTLKKNRDYREILGCVSLDQNAA